MKDRKTQDTIKKKEEGFLVLATVEPMPIGYSQKRSSRTSYSSQVVEEAHLQISALPPKPKTQFDLLETVIYLRPDIIDAFEKNYTQEEVTVILRKVGIVSKDPNLRHFWRLFQAEDKNIKSQKNTPLKTAGKGKNDVPVSPDAVLEKRKKHKAASIETPKNVNDERPKEDISVASKSSLYPDNAESTTKTKRPPAKSRWVSFATESRLYRLKPAKKSAG